MNDRICRIGAAVTGLMSAIVFCAAGAEGQTTRPATRRAGPARHIVVLGLKNRTPDRNTAWIGRVLAEATSSKLGRVKGLKSREHDRVIPVLKREALTGADLSDPKTALRLAKLLRVDRVVVGDFTSDGETVRCTLRVLDAGSGLALGSHEATERRAALHYLPFKLLEGVLKTYDREIASVNGRATVVDAPAADRIALTAQEKESLREPFMENLKVWEAFCRGLTAANYKEEIRWYSETIRLDPRCERAHNNLGKALYFEGRVADVQSVKRRPVRKIHVYPRQPARAARLRRSGNLVFAGLSNLIHTMFDEFGGQI